MLKWYADNTELSTDKSKPNVLVFGGVIVDSDSEKKIIALMKEVKSQFTYPTMPVKYNLRDLKNTYAEFDRVLEFNQLKEKSYEWRMEIFKRSLEIEYKVILACTERHPSPIPLKKIKEKLTGICFSQSLMRVGLFAKYRKFNDCFEVILDWPDAGNPKPFNREYFKAYNTGRSQSGVDYYSGPLIDLGFKDSLYFAKSTHSNILQFADLVIGAARDFILKTIHSYDHSLGYELTRIILQKYHGYPKKVIEYGMNFAPKESENYFKIQEEIKRYVP